MIFVVPRSPETSGELRTQKPKNKKPQTKKACGFCGTSQNRTADTRIFSPLLYQLS